MVTLKVYYLNLLGIFLPFVISRSWTSISILRAAVCLGVAGGALEFLIIWSISGSFLVLLSEYYYSLNYLMISDLLRGLHRQKIVYIIIRFYAIMYRTTIVQNKIISIICSCLFFVRLIFIGLV